jgi:hypothetical protein
MRWLTIPLVLAFSLSACGEGSESAPSPEDASTGSTEVTQGSRYAEDDPEALLATIDSGGDVPSDHIIARYGRLLDKMDRVCREPRARLADQVANGSQILKDEKDLEYSMLEMAQAYVSALTPKLGRNQRCSDLFAGVLALTTAEE